MLELKHLTIGYGRRLLLDNVDTSIPAGALTALLGRNGTGKSTLLRAIAGLEKPMAGHVLIGGRALDTLTPRERALSVAFVATKRVRVPDMPVADLVAMGRAPYTNWIGRMRPEDADTVSRAVRLVGMEEMTRRPLDSLSDGECQRAMIARALAQDTPIILLDEPTSFLDLPSRHELVGLLRRLAREQGKCILFSTHELDIALRLADRIVLIDPPGLINLPAAEMAAAPHIPRLFSIPTPN